MTELEILKIQRDRASKYLLKLVKTKHKKIKQLIAGYDKRIIIAHSEFNELHWKICKLNHKKRISYIEENKKG